MNKARNIMLAALVALAAAACQPDGSDVDGKVSGKVYDIDVNGTRCIVHDGDYSGGIDCAFGR